MSERIHRDFDAYCTPAPPLSEARLFSLKLEYIEISPLRRRYVDAILLSGNELIAVPFIYIAEGGAAVLHERCQLLHPAVREWLVKTASQWAAAKGLDATLDADLFDNDNALRSLILDAVGKNDRAFAGLSPYAALFNEAERYANLTPFTIGRSVIDFNPGLGYGPRILAQAAAAVSVPKSALTLFTKRLRPSLGRAEAGADTAIWLDVQSQDVEQTVERLKEAVRPGGFAIISLRGEGAADTLRAAGADAFKMTRPGCEGLGAVDEWLGAFAHVTGASYHDVPAMPEKPGHVEVAPRPLRVLFGLRPSAESIFGGDVVQVRETAQALRARGHFVEVSTAPALESRGFDVVHLTNLTVPPETLPQAQSVASFDGAVVLMPIFTDHCDEAVWGMNATTSVFGSHQDLQDLHQKLSMLEARNLHVGRLYPPPQRMEMVDDYTPMQKATLDVVDFVIANAHSEMHRLYRYLSSELPYAVAPSCANPLVYGPQTRKRFVDRFGFEDYVLLAGRYEGRKNQLAFFEATRSMGLPLLFIGNNYQATFARILRIHRPGNAAYIGHLPEADLAGAFAAARVVAIPSWDEVVSLTSLNAAISGASMVLTRNSYEHEYFMDDAAYCDPGSISSIAAAVRRAWDTHEARKERRERLIERVMRDFNWQRSAALTEEAYYRVLAHNPRRDRRLAHFSAAPERV